MQDAVDIWEVEQKYKKSPAIAPFAFEALIASA
jgi:hypothetical protein